MLGVPCSAVNNSDSGLSQEKSTVWCGLRDGYSPKVNILALYASPSVVAAYRFSGILPGEDMRVQLYEWRHNHLQGNPERQYPATSSHGENPLPLRKKKKAVTPCGVSPGRGIRPRRRFFALLLTSELDALCGENANPATSSHGENPLPLRQKKKSSYTVWCICFFGAEGGIRTLVCFWHKLISSQPRYDHFDTSAYMMQ